MTAVMPLQKPHRSVQEVATPWDLIDAVEARFGRLTFDLAADKQKLQGPPRDEASKTNKQAGTASGAAELTETIAACLLAEERALLFQIEDLYQRKLEAGFPKELARTHLNISRYSRMRATANLHNWLHFLTLREAPGAQFEIRQYAHAVSAIIAELFPRTHALYVERTSC